MTGSRAAIAAALTLFACSGCTSFTTLGRARTLEPGRVEVWGAPEAYAVLSEDGAFVRGTAEAGVRVGATREVEIDARLGTLSVAVGPRIQLHRSQDPRSGVDLLIAPSVRWTYVDKLSIDTALLLGINLGEHQLVLAARVAYQMRVGVGGQDAPVRLGYAGGSVGAALSVDPRVILMPEIALLTEIAADPGFASPFAGAAGMQGSLGVLVEL